MIVVVISNSKKYPTLILWIPILFFQVMKAETDFATVFNYLTKAAIITFLAFYLTNVIMEMTRKKPKISMNPPATSNENI